MAKKNDTEATIGFLLFIIFIIVIGAFFLLKWAIIFLVIIISAIVVGVINLSRKNNRKNFIKKVIENNFSDSVLKPIPKISQKELKEKLGLFDIDIYDEYFESKIKPRGQTYFAEGRLKKVKNDGDLWLCEIVGTETYNVSIRFEENRIIETNCTCPYHKEDNKNCKHMYALLIKAKCEWNLPKILEAITEYSGRLTKLIKEETEYISKNQKNLKLNGNDLSIFNNDINEFMQKLNNASKSLEKNKYNETALLNILINIIESSYNYNKKVEDILVKAGKVDNPVSMNKVFNSYSSNDDKIKLSDIVLGAAVANEIDKHIHKKEDDVDEELEREMDDYCLDDWQKDLVRSGEYYPWSFDEDEIDEDSYYYEEDNK